MNISNPIDIYYNFAKVRYDKLADTIYEKLEKDAYSLIKTYRFYIEFFVKVEGSWKFDKRQLTRRVWICKKIPSDDATLFRYMKEKWPKPTFSTLSRPLFILNNQFFEKLIAAYDQPVESPIVQEVLKEYRNICANKNAKEQFINEAKNKCKEIIFEDLRQIHAEVRLGKMEIEVTYVKEGQQDNNTVQDTKDLSQQCHSCKKWWSTAHKLRMCERCRKAFYCNKECQKNGWLEHKAQCLKFKRSENIP